jgi:hypothetical protein
MSASCRRPRDQLPPHRSRGIGEEVARALRVYRAIAAAAGLWPDEHRSWLQFPHKRCCTTDCTATVAPFF